MTGIRVEVVLDRAVPEVGSKANAVVLDEALEVGWYVANG